MILVRCLRKSENELTDLVEFGGAAASPEFKILLDPEKQKDIIWLQIFDPQNPIVLLTEFSVLPGKRKVRGGGATLELTCATRCYLVPEQYLSVTITLKIEKGEVLLKTYTVGKEEPEQWGSSEPHTLSKLLQYKFTLKGVGTSFAHGAIPKLGIGWPSEEWWTLASEATAKGFQFSTTFPLEDAWRTIKPFALALNEKALQKGLFAIQRPPGPPAASPAKLDPVLFRRDSHVIVELYIPGGPVLESWGQFFAAPYRAALSAVRDGARATFLPDFGEYHGASWRVIFSFCDRNKSDKCDDQDPLPFRFVAPGRGELPDGVISIVPRCIVPSAEGATAVMSFPAIAGADEIPPLTCSIGFLGSATDSEKNLCPEVPGYGFSVKTTGLKNPGNLGTRLRLGSLDFRIEFCEHDPKDLMGSINGSFRMAPSREGALPWIPRLERLQLKIPVTEMTPGGQDPLPDEEYAERDASFSVCGGDSRDSGDRRQQPLVIPLAKANTLRKAYLDVSERAFERQSQTIDVKLLGDTVATKFDLLMVDPEPLLIARVQAAPTLVAEADGKLLGTWSNRSAALNWDLRIADGRFGLQLPPQAIGEAMHRRRGEGDIPNAPEPIAFRFGPPLVAELDASYFERAFVTAPWDLRLILGYPGQRDPGARLRRLRFELLYGVAGTLVNPSVRIAEIQSRLGAMQAALSAQANRLSWPSNQAQQGSWNDHLTQWSALYLALSRRPAVLEPWLPPPREVAPAPGRPGEALTLTEKHGLAFQIRKSADLWSEDNRNGLKGSYAWAIESKKLLDGLRNAPYSSSGELTGPLFSSFGGWGRQVARFNNDMTAIISETEMGRLASLTVERIGRIGVYRNKAKHVIVYRRTVAPTRQFALQQEPFLGAPILRKAEEFIELLQPRRDYENRGVQAENCGFVRALNFPGGTHPRIPVDSTWGEDTLNGWKIPLWKPGAQPADVYPRPDVDFLFEGSSADDRVRGPNSEPEKLCFYTWIDKRATADTDSWDPELGVDFGELWLPDKPEPKDERWAGLDEPGGTFEKPSDFSQTPRAYHPRLGAFTWAVAAEGGVNVTAARGANAVLSVPRTVSLMWGMPKVLDPAKGGGRMAAQNAAGRAAEIVFLLRSAVQMQSAEKPEERAARVMEQVAGLPPGYTAKTEEVLSLYGACDKAAGVVDAVGNHVQAAATQALGRCRVEAHGFFAGLRVELGEDFAKARGQIALRWRIQKRSLLADANAFRARIADAAEPLHAAADVLTSAGKKAAEIAHDLDGELMKAAPAADEVNKKLTLLREQLAAGVRTAKDGLTEAGIPDWLKPRAGDLARNIGELGDDADGRLKDLQGKVNAASVSELRAEVRATARRAIGAIGRVTEVAAGLRNEFVSKVEHFGDSELSATEATVEKKLREIDRLIAAEGQNWTDLLDKVDKWAAGIEAGLDDLVKQQVESVRKGAGVLHSWCELLDPDKVLTPTPDKDLDVCAVLKTAVKRQIDLAEKPIEIALAGLPTALKDTIHSLLETQKPKGDPAAVKRDLLDALAGARTAVHSGLDFTGSQVQSLLNTARTAQADAFCAAGKAIDKLQADVAGWNDETADARKQVTSAFAAAQETLREAEEAASAAVRRYAAGGLDRLQSEIRVLRLRLEAAQARCLEALAAFPAGRAKARVLAELIAARKRLDEISGVLLGRIAAVEAGVADAAGALEKLLDDIFQSIERQILEIPDGMDWETFLKRVDDKVDQSADTIRNQVMSHISQLKSAVDGWTGLCGKTLGSLGDMAALARSVFGGDVVAGLAQKLGADAAEAARLLEEEARHLAEETGRILRRIELSLKAPELPNIAGSLQLIRAFGDVPKVPGLDFNVDKMAFHFVKWPDVGLPPVNLPDVDLSRIAAQVNKSLELPSLNINLPAIRLGDVFGTPDPQAVKFDLTKYLPKFAGLDLGKLFQGLNLPISEKDIKITHGEDVATRSGWVRVDMDVSLGDKPADLFNFGGIVIALTGGRFQGRVTAEGGLNQPVRHREWGQLSGDWEIRAGGQPIVILRKAALIKEESGRINFDITPQNVELQQALQFLNDLMTPLAEPGQGLSFEFSPKGALVRMDLPLPDYQGGAFGIANLSLGFYFAALLGGEFHLSTGLTVARRERPFTLTIFVLGGAGFLELDVDYTPNTGAITAALDVGIFASASLAIALGPVKGGVYAYFGLEVHYQASTDKGSQLYIAIVLMFYGAVSLLGFLSVSLSLRLQAVYQGGGRLVGRGTISYSIKLGPFWKIDVSSAVEYTYGNPALSDKPNTKKLADLANEYYDLFLN